VTVIALLDRLDRGALEGDIGELLRVEEIGAAQVIVTLLLGRVDRLGPNGDGESRLCGIILVDDELAGHVVESAMNPGQAEMRHAERNAGMSGIDVIIVRGLDGQGHEEQGQQGHNAAAEILGHFRSFNRVANRHEPAHAGRTSCRTAADTGKHTDRPRLFKTRPFAIL
jgi:hypothetical protein